MDSLSWLFPCAQTYGPLLRVDMNDSRRTNFRLKPAGYRRERNQVAVYFRYCGIRPPVALYEKYSMRYVTYICNSSHQFAVIEMSRSRVTHVILP